MLSRVLLSLFGLVHIANGVFMVFDAEGWYRAAPGVSQTGPPNHHFIVDIGLAFIASGAGMALAFRGGRAAASFVLAGATWPLLHALFHISGWLVEGFPHDPRVQATEALGVVSIGVLGFALAGFHARKQGAI